MAENVRSGERIFDLLETLSEHRGPISLTELANETSLSKTTAHRLMQTLCARQYAVKTYNSQYLVGPKVIELASYHIEHLDLHRIAKPLMAELYSAFQMTVYLGKVIGDRIVYIQLFDRKSIRENDSELSIGVPAYPSSIGKCLFASLSGDEIDSLLYHHPLERYTDKTITDPAEYKKMLRAVRAQGWAIDDEEYMTGYRCIGAPIYDYSGSVIASISLTGSLEQMAEERQPVIIDALKRTASVISKGMGYLP